MYNIIVLTDEGGEQMKARLVIEIDDKLKSKIKALADLEDATMTDVVTQSVEDFIESYTHKDKVDQLVKIKEGN